MSKKATHFVWLFLFPLITFANVNTEDWTLTLIINSKGSLKEKLFRYEDRGTCYDEMFEKIKQVKKSGDSASGICMKLFVGNSVADPQKDYLKIIK